MRYGFALPKSTDGSGLVKFAQAVEDLGFESVWVGDHIVLPAGETDQYPYTPDGRFVSRPDDPQLDAFIVLSYIASSTSTVDIGTTVAIVPYRNPILQAKMFATLDVLTGGRAVCGGVSRRALRLRRNLLCSQAGARWPHSYLGRRTHPKGSQAYG